MAGFMLGGIFEGLASGLLEMEAGDMANEMLDGQKAKMLEKKKAQDAVNQIFG